MQVIGIGSQDDFSYAREFVTNIGTGTPTMLWDPEFNVWPPFGVTTNSQMMLLSGDFATGTDLFFGFSEEVRAQVLEIARDLDS